MNSRSLLLRLNRVYSPSGSRASAARCPRRAFAFLLVFAAGLQLHAASGSIENELLVKWKDGPESPAAAQGNASIGSAVQHNFNELGWQHVKLPPSLSLSAGIKAYRGLGTVVAVEPNRVIPTHPPKESIVSIYSGDQLEQLVPIAGNDNYGTRSASRVSFRALPGTHYSLAVTGKATVLADLVDASKFGKFTITWYPTPPPGFTGSELSLATGIPGAQVTLTGTNFSGATSVLFNGASASFTNAANNNRDLRITAVVPPDASSEPVTVVTPHGRATSFASFEVMPPPLSVTYRPMSGLEISWPATRSALMLQESTDIRGDSWTPVAQVPVVAAGQSKVTVTPQADRFYRLHRL